jgi:hypothetical protein
MLYTQTALAFASSGSRSDRPAARDREARTERWTQRVDWTDLLATTEIEWRKRLAPRAGECSKSNPVAQPEALFCRFEVDNVFDR